MLPYINADPVIAKRLQEVGCATVMPLGAPIGSNGGLQTRDQIRIILIKLPCRWWSMPALARRVTPPRRWSWARMPLLVNTAIAVNDDPCRMARAFAQAVEAGRMAYEIGLGSYPCYSAGDQPVDCFLDE